MLRFNRVLIARPNRSPSSSCRVLLSPAFQDMQRTECGAALHTVLLQGCVMHVEEPPLERLSGRSLDWAVVWDEERTEKHYCVGVE